MTSQVRLEGRRVITVSTLDTASQEMTTRIAVQLLENERQKKSEGQWVYRDVQTVLVEVKKKDGECGEILPATHQVPMCYLQFICFLPCRPRQESAVRVR